MKSCSSVLCSAAATRLRSRLCSSSQVLRIAAGECTADGDMARGLGDRLQDRVDERVFVLLVVAGRVAWMLMDARTFPALRPGRFRAIKRVST
jgi:hypothetical protein